MALIKVHCSADESTRERYNTLTSVSFGLRGTTPHGFELCFPENWFPELSQIFSVHVEGMILSRKQICRKTKFPEVWVICGIGVTYGGTRGTSTRHFLDWGVPYPRLFRTQVKNLLSSEAICGDQITLKPFSAGAPSRTHHQRAPVLCRFPSIG